MKTLTQVLDRISMVSIEVTSWSGARKLKPEDLDLGDEGQLPSDEVVSLGTKKLCDKALLQPFVRLREQANRLCATEGLRFLGGYAVPNSKVATLSTGLDPLKQQFEDQKQQFLANYEHHVEDWVQQHPEFAAAIRSAVPDVTDVGQRFGFDYTVIKVAVPEALPQRLEQQVECLGDTLRDDISQEARRLFRETFKGRTDVGQKALRPLRRLRDKLEGLAFVDDGIAPLVQWLDEGLAGLPKKGKLSGPDLTVVMDRVLVLGSPEQMQQCAEGLAQRVGPLLPVNEDGRDVSETLSDTDAPDGATVAEVSEALASGLDLDPNLLAALDNLDSALIPACETVSTDTRKTQDLPAPDPVEPAETAVASFYW